MSCNCKNKCKSVEQYKEDVMKELKKRLDKCFIGSEETQRTVENSYWEMIKDMLNVKNPASLKKQANNDKYEIYITSDKKGICATLFYNDRHICSSTIPVKEYGEEDFNVGASLALKDLIEKAINLEDIAEIEKDIEYKNNQAKSMLNCNFKRKILGREISKAKEVFSKINRLSYNKNLCDGLKKLYLEFQEAVIFPNMDIKAIKVDKGNILFTDGKIREASTLDFYNLLTLWYAIIQQFDKYSIIDTGYGWYYDNDKNQKA